MKTPEFNNRFHKITRADQALNRSTSYLMGWDAAISKGHLWMTIANERYINSLNVRYLDNPEWFTVHPFRK